MHLRASLDMTFSNRLPFSVDNVFCKSVECFNNGAVWASEVETCMAWTMEWTTVLADNANGYTFVQNFIHCFATFFTEFCPVKEHYVCTLWFLCFYEAAPCLHYIVSVLLVGFDYFDEFINVLATFIVSTYESVYRQNVWLVVVCLSCQFSTFCTTFVVVDN